LKTVAQRCNGEIRDIDIIGRYGGEEFVVLLPETSITDACQIAERLLRCVEKQTISTDRGMIPVTISLGVACVDEKDEDLTGLIEKADKAMYLAKQAGRNCIKNRADEYQCDE
ncbi:MAG: GGDEF domain-containing protein, partial [Deltaproteobacteria bacterium]|nr:GGDEF domain-containing protein [Deltaproteobacteria bacterium]